MLQIQVLRTKPINDGDECKLLLTEATEDLWRRPRTNNECPTDDDQQQHNEGKKEIIIIIIIHCTF